MNDQSEIEEMYLNEDVTEDSSDNALSKEERKSRPLLRDAVHKSMLPRNFERLKKFFDCSEHVGVNRNRSQTSTSQPSNKGPAEALKAFREISYTRFKKTPSSEEESCCSKDSHVDSEDSGLFREGYVFERKSQPISKNKVNKKVEKWKKTAAEQLEEVNKLYKQGRSKNKETFSVPLGLEANRKKVAEPPDDVSSQSDSRISGQYNTEDEMDIRRNDEFMREVRRALRSKKNPQTLEKRSLPEEYSRLIFKKAVAARNRDRQAQNVLALTGKADGPATGNTDTGADGYNTSGPVPGIFDQLSKMVLKNKIAKHSKAAQQRNEVLRRVEEKRGFADDMQNSDVEEKVSRTPANKPKNEFESHPVPSSEFQIARYKGQNQASENQQELEIAEHEAFLDLADQGDATSSRLKKVERYLSSVSDVQSTPAMPEISCLTPEREQSLFDSLTGEFLKNLATGNERRNKITRNDKKLLTIIVKRYIDRGELAQIDRLMNSNMNENILEVPPYENVTDREEFFLKKIIRKFIKRGMRNALEDLIAWIYYKLEARKAKVQDKQEDKICSDKEVRDMINAFKNSGKNPSMNRIVMQLLKEHKKANPGLNSRQINFVREVIQDLVIERFARMYLEHTKTDVDRNSEPLALAVNVKNEFAMNGGLELIDVNGRDVHIKWNFTSIEGEAKRSSEPNTEHETDEDPSVDEASPCASPIEPEMLNHDNEAMKLEFEKKANFVKERLEDIVWSLQQNFHRQKAGKVNRTCSLVKKRSVTMIGDPNKGSKFTEKVKDKKSNFEERRKQMREEHVKWLLEQKEMLRDAKRKEASNIEKYTQALPKKIESMIARRNRSLKQFDHRNAVVKNNPTAKLQKK